MNRVIVPLTRLMRPKLKYYVLRRDGRDEIVYAGKDILFYREGLEEPEGATWSLVATKHNLHPRLVRSTHKLYPKRVRIYPTRPKVRFENEHYQSVKSIELVGDDGSVTAKASINPSKGIVYVNRDFFQGLPWLWKVYVVFHEVAHLWMTEEESTDLWASYLYVKAGYPPSQAAMCLKYTLSDENPEKQERRAAAVENLLSNVKIAML